MDSVRSIRWVGWLSLVLVLSAVSLHAQEPAAPGDSPAGNSAKVPEKISNTRSAVEKGHQVIEKLQKKLDDPNGEYIKAESDFQTSEKRLKEAKEKVAQLKKDGMTAEAAELEAMLPRFEEERQLARERFNLAIRQRKITLEALAALKIRVSKDQEMLDRLEGKIVVAPVEPAAPQKPVAEESPPKPAIEAQSLIPGMPVASSNGAAPIATVAPVLSLENDPVVQDAREALANKRLELREAEARAATANDQVRAMERSIKSSGQMLKLEQESAAQAERAATRLSDTLFNNPPADLAEQQLLADRLAEARQRGEEAKDRAKRIADRLAVHTETLKELQAEADAAGKEVDNLNAAVIAAEEHVNELLSPFTMRNLSRRFVDHGPQVLGIVLAMTVLHLLTRQFSRQIVRLVARDGHRGSVEDRENRASTLVGVFRYATALGIFVGGFIMILDEIGVPIVPLMGGAAVVGLAVAFGAQNLVRDYFSGFMMLMEDQYSVNDVVRIGTVSGLVEEITLRVTVLRDLEGVRHFIPHGTITNVSNLTHGWSRALFDIPVSYRTDVDQVIRVLTELGRDMRSDPKLGHFVLEDPEMLGVDSFAESAIIIKFFLKTRPLKQWPVKREMLRRIKNRFDQLGIEIPVPERTVFHRYEGESSEKGASLAAKEFRTAG